MYDDHGARCWLPLSSPHFTQQAFTINMELRMLARAGTMPRWVEDGRWNPESPVLQQ